jgi:hypothetical protein
VWAFRARAERVAAARFSRLSDVLARSGAHDAVVGLARDAVGDELRHADLCTWLARRFGSTADEAPEPAPEVGPSSATARERVLFEVVAMSCVTETVSAAALGRMLERAENSAVRDTVQAVLRDEINHAQLGWAHLAREHRSGAVPFVADYLPAMLAQTVGDELFAAGPDVDADLAGLGALSRRDRQEVVVESLEHVIFPGLERFEVDTSAGRRWLASHVTRGEAVSSVG